ncbi:redoxin domain-containing protein [Ascidiimonas sp. W6]|uniref:redoxin domain-containing protein n=1 Tax=Ascidiimonas meishanensis TaxID=3128903 RepID=UPI0030EC3A96
MKYLSKKTAGILLPILLIGFTILLGFQQKDTEEYFEIEGTFIGKNTKEIILIYGDANQNTKIDTIAIQNNGSFKSKGTIKGFTSANIKGNVKSNSVEDPNYVFIFIEPGINKIKLEENNFKSIKISDNRSFKLYKKLYKSIDSIYSVNNWKAIVKQRNNYYADHLVFPKNKMLKDSMDYFNLKIDKVVNLINNKKREFITKYAKDLVSTFVLQMEFKSNRIGVKDTRNYFNNFSKSVQESSHGQEVLKMFQKIERSLVGNKASDFEATDYLGNKLQLSDFKGKHVLLDFWAGWCKPCKKNHPAMKAIYNQYHNKGLEFIGVSFDRDEEEWKESIALENLDLWHQVLGDYRDSDENAIHNKFNVMPIPAYILIDDKGYIVGRYLGADRYDGNENGRDGIPELKQKLQQIYSKS